MSYRVYSLGVDLRRLKEIVELVQYRPKAPPYDTSKSTE
jgi:hypothetical protein